MNYKPRDGITRVFICGAWLLIPNRKASELCPNIATISFPELIIWRQLEKGKDTEKVCSFFSDFFHKTLEESREVVKSFLDRMYERGFIVLVEENIE